MDTPDDAPGRSAAWLPGRPGSPWSVWSLWWLGLLCLVPLAYGLVGLLMAPAAAAADRPAWRLPLDGPARVAAPLAVPAGPYAAGHRGVDLVAAPAARVLAPATGVVAFAGRVAGLGVVSVDHPGGLRSTYQPVEAVVHRGDRVAAGAVLGLLVGAGGHCPPAACLHWGLRRGADYLDPMALLGTPRVRLLPVWSATGVERTVPPLPAPATPPAPSGREATPTRVGDPRRAGHPGPGGGHPVGLTGLAGGLTGLAGGVTLAAGSRRRRAPP